MKLLNFIQDNSIVVGIRTEAGVVSLEEVGALARTEVPQTMEALIGNFDKERLEALLAAVTNQVNFIPEEDLTYAPVVTQPEKILCVGLNYLDHVAEAKDQAVPDEPVIFSKFNNALAAHGEVVMVPTEGHEFDYEAELVIVMGRQAHNVSVDEALDYVFGYTMGNDLSVRDLQFKGAKQWLLGKTPDKFAPVGPHIVLADDIDATQLDIVMKRNGKTVQSSNTRHMIFDLATIVSYLSRHMTLKAGDLIFTGTPEGVVLGLEGEDRKWLEAGETLEVVVEGIGSLVNRFGSMK